MSCRRPVSALLPAALALLLPQAASAKCAAGGVTAWPPDQALLPPNGRIVLRATGMGRAGLRDLALKGPRLVAGKERVPLRVLTRNDGEHSVSQVVLEPAAPLRPSTAYQLEVPGVEVRARWTTSAGPDQFPPRWRGEPRVLRSERQSFGCGPASHVTISVPAEDDRGLLLLEAQVRRAGGAASPVRFLVEVQERMASLGHGMCSGPFRLEPGERYEATLRLVDVAGNEVAAPGKPLLLTGPTESPPAQP